MNILVTGAGGFIGRNMVERLVEEGYDVTAFVYEKNETDSLLEELGVEIIKGDITRKESVKGLTEGFDIVLNFASQIRGWTETENTSHMVNVVGTRYLIEDCMDNGVEQFIHCSTSSIIGPVEDEPLDESSDRRDRSRVYYRTKLEGEREVMSRKDDIPVTVLLPPLVYGPHDTHHLKIFEAVRDKKIHFVGKGDNLFQPTYIDDFLEGAILTIKNEDAYGERFIIGNDRPRTTHDIIYSIADGFGIDINPLHVPRSAAWIGYHVLEFAGNVFGFKPPLTERVYDWFTENHHFDVSKAKDVLGFEPEVSLEEGMRKTVEWYQENGWL